MRAPLLSTSLLLLAACGGAETPPVAPSPSPSAPSPAPSPAPIAKSPPPDAAFPARAAFSNPGGMWMPQQMALPAHAETFAKLGVTLDPKVLADPLAAPLGAIVWLGGCTGSFVSPEGLVATNHHCAQGALQQNATADANIVETGFLAKTKADERPAGAAQHIQVAQAFRDVTKEIMGGLEKIADPVARKDETDKRIKQLLAACEKDRPEVRCQVSSFFDGGVYELIEMLDIKDVRLVYAPARAVGNFGGEIDNWAWPRHTGDWSFFRAYVGKDGKPAAYSPDNVPYRPKTTLKVSTAGLLPSDFVMVAGYPGRTFRTETASEAHESSERTIPYTVAYLKDLYAIAEARLKDGGDTAIKATVLKQGAQNALEKWEGVLAGVKKGDVLAKKDAVDAKVKAWAAQPGHEAHKKSLERLEALITERGKSFKVDVDRSRAFGGSRLLGTAMSLVRWAEEREKKDEARKLGYQERDLSRAVGAQKQFAKAYDRGIEKDTLRLVFTRAAQLPEKDRPWLATLLGAKAGQKIDAAFIEATVDAWLKAQRLEDEATRLQLLQKGTMQDMRASKDPFIQAALRVWPVYRAEEKKDDARAGEMLLVRPSYAEGLKQLAGGVLAPDANATLRITYGTVRSLKPGSPDIADAPFTTASQLLAKDTGKAPFDVPAKLKEAIKKQAFGAYASPALGGELPIDFMSDLDITGGNSGSPTMNAKGELVGLAFDGNTEGLVSDKVWDGAQTRTIHVDARYMIWTMDTLDGAKHLVREMGLTPTP